MEGLAKNACSTGAGYGTGCLTKPALRSSFRSQTQRYFFVFVNWLRNRLGERYFIPVAPSLFAVRNYIIHSFQEIRRAIRFASAVFFRPAILFFAALLLFGQADKSYAVPIHEPYQSCIRNITEYNPPGCDTFGFYSAGMPFSQWLLGDFREADNVEWIYHALENRYAFLDNTLYKISGGGYFLWPGYYPYQYGFRHYNKYGKPRKIIIYIPKDAADCENAHIEQIQSGDMRTLSASLRRNNRGQLYYPASLRQIPSRSTPGFGANMDAKAVPEPSTFMLFGFTALQILMLRKIGRNLKEGN